MRWDRFVAAAALALIFVLAVGARAATVPRADHVVVVIMENHAYAQIMDGKAAPYIHALAAQGANFIQSFAVAHPSEPNYFALFAGSTEGITDDGTYDLDKPTLAGALAAAGKSFAGYAERGSPRKHNTWESFADARGTGRDFAAFPADFATLPTVSFVIPDLDHDMHDGSVADGDAWLRRALDPYVRWALGHDDVLVLTFDEDDHSAANRIPTIILGGQVKPGTYDERIDHYTVLRTIAALAGVPPVGESAKRAPIADIWR
jgi:phosphatidylinositol-3-phosphatase